MKTRRRNRPNWHWLRERPAAVLDRLYGFDAFLSYSWSDGEDYARNLAERLRAEGRRVFLDQDPEDGYVAGTDLPEATSRRVGASSVLVVILSPGSLESDWVAKEVEVFLARQRNPVLYQDSADAPLRPDSRRRRLGRLASGGGSQPRDSVRVPLSV